MDFLSGASATILGSLAMLSVPAYFVLQTWLAVTLKGRRRMWALLPLPFILFAPMGTIYLVAVLVLSKAFSTRLDDRSANS